VMAETTASYSFTLDGIKFSCCSKGVAPKNVIDIEGVDFEEYLWKKTLSSDEIESISKFSCANGEELISYFKNGTNRAKNVNLSLEKGEKKLALYVSHLNPVTDLTRKFSLVLDSTEQTDCDRTTRLISNVMKKKANKESFHFDPNTCHAHIKLFYNNTVATKLVDGWHCVSTNEQCQNGKFFWLVRILNIPSGHIMVGIVEQTQTLDTHPGTGIYQSGKGFYGANGHMYHDNTSEDYGIGGFSSCFYVGTLLDMDQKTVKFSVNGIEGEAKKITQNSCYFVIGLHSAKSSIEIVQKHCWRS